MTACQKKERVIVLKVSPEQRLMWALAGEDPDRQRTALNKLAKSKPVKQGRPRFVEALGLIARTDPNPQVRCAALRTLAATPDQGELIKSSLALVKDDDARVRRDACEMLYKVLKEGSPAAQVRAQAREALLARLVNDPSADVRVCACEGLGYCRDLEVVQTLITAVQERDFTVAYHADRALTRLTGKRFDCDPERWKRWLAEVGDPFKGRAAAERTSGRAGGAVSAKRAWWRR